MRGGWVGTWPPGLWSGYLVPVKDVVRAAEELAPGDMVAVELVIRSDRLAL